MHRKKKNNNADIDTPSGKIESLIRIQHDNTAAAEFKTLQLTSAFQPIFSLVHRKPVGYEALLRARTAQGAPVSPPQVFSMADGGAELTRLDRLCRVLHVRNFQSANVENSWLFLNINPEVVVHGKNYGAFFSEMLERHAFPAHRVVVEVLEDSIRDESLLTEAVEYYRQLGCLVAIDDFGSGHSNFERIWRVAPDIVKLDRSVILQALSNKKARRVLPSLVSLLHETGGLVLMEGVETQEEALVSMDADIDFVQGYYFGRPAAITDAKPAAGCPLTDLCDKFKAMVTQEAKAPRARIATCMAAFKQSADMLKAGIPLERACAALLSKTGALRCYLLDGEGEQVSANLTPPSSAAPTDPRFAVLTGGIGARWFRRTYFRRAIFQRGEVQMSRPYLSLTGIHMCVTLSIALECAGATRVFCCDLDWESISE